MLGGSKLLLARVVGTFATILCSGTTLDAEITDVIHVYLLVLLMIL